jgi:hypothetical protein
MPHASLYFPHKLREKRSDRHNTSNPERLVKQMQQTSNLHSNIIITTDQLGMMEMHTLEKQMIAVSDKQYHLKLKYILVALSELNWSKELSFSSAEMSTPKTSYYVV